MSDDWAFASAEALRKGARVMRERSRWQGASASRRRCAHESCRDCDGAGVKTTMLSHLLPLRRGCIARGLRSGIRTVPGRAAMVARAECQWMVCEARMCSGAAHDAIVHFMRQLLSGGRIQRRFGLVAPSGADGWSFEAAAGANVAAASGAARNLAALALKRQRRGY
ncbi:hypothetical protein B0H19DRAFT_1084333 [Mycena capillaripes]|nr:hypothetical protein B0H19DRAFT_1084333 [Mycena capillaripes]